jgi:hypothetical protein
MTNQDNLHDDISSDLMSQHDVPRDEMEGLQRTLAESDSLEEDDQA